MTKYQIYPLLELKTLPQKEGELLLQAGQKPIDKNVHVEKSTVIAARFSSESSGV
jgi:hypothetical protein